MATFMSEPSDPVTVTGGIVSAFVRAGLANLNN